MKTINAIISLRHRVTSPVFLLAAMVTIAACEADTTETTDQTVTRCGWFDNPTPGNAWLYDRDGDWTVGIQGGHQATGEWPHFKASDRVRTGHGSAGYGCVCLKVKANTETHEILTILSAQTKPLLDCRRDAAIKNREPENPLE